MWLADRTMVALRRALPRPKVATRRICATTPKEFIEALNA